MLQTEGKPVISDGNYTFLQSYVYEQSGIVLDRGKEYLFDTRLTPILKERNLGSLDSLCALLRATTDTSLRREVLEAMTTNETLFFRDNAPFDALRNQILPELMRTRAQTRAISIWSAAASTGQEIYSIAMLLLEAGLKDWKLNLFATDYSSQVLRKAEQGRYRQIEINRGLPAALLVKYFERKGLEWEIKPEVRRLVRFEQRDLRRDMSGLGPFDVVFCRNVLIYFDVRTKDVVLSQIARTMPSGGWLLLGVSETLLNLDCPFNRTEAGQTVLYRRR